MVRPIFTLAIVGLLASACSERGSSGTAQPVQSTPAPQSPAPTATEPAPSAPNSSATPPSAPAPAPAAAASPDAPRAPEFRDFTIPAGRRISVTLTTPVASDTSKVEDPVRGTLAQPLVVSGTTVVPAGASVTGTVIEAKQSGRVKGRAVVALQFERLTVRDESHDIRTARITRQAASSQRDDIKKGAIGAGVGAIVGGIIGGGKGAAIGAGAGGAGTVLATRGKEIRLPAGTTVTTTLQEALTLSVPLAAK